ncbi:MAG: hypothetical protein ACRDV8_07380, partial [Acidimicrobiales bacterium]
PGDRGPACFSDPEPQGRRARCGRGGNVALSGTARAARGGSLDATMLWSPAAAWARGHAAALACTLAVVASGMALSLLWLPLVDHGSGWLTPGDLWGTFRDAHLVGWGGEADIYQSGTGYLSPPAFPVLLAPVAMASGALHLTESLPLFLRHPTAWLLLGPAGFLCVAPLLLAGDAVARRLVVPRARRVASLWVCAGLSVPLLWLWGHPEDLLALACALYALLAAWSGRWTKAACLVGLGLAFQPLVVLVLPVVLARVPWRQLPRAIAIAAAPAVLLLAAPFAHAWRTTLHAVVDQPTFPALGHATPWLALAPALHAHGPGMLPEPGRLFTTSALATAGGPGRILAVLLAVALGLLVRRLRPSEQTVVAVAALCLSLRCVFEPVMFPYYVVPALLLAVLGAAAVGRRRFIVSVGAVAACSWAAYSGAAPWAYYLLVTGLLLVACALAVRAPLGFEWQRAGEPAGGGAAVGSNGSRVAPQVGNVVGAWAPLEVCEVAVAEDVETVATVRTLGLAIGAAEP